MTRAGTAPETVAEIVRLRREGMGMRGVSRRLGVTYAAVRAHWDKDPGPAPDWRAACMDDDEWAGWQALNLRVGYGPVSTVRAKRPCDDCTLGFAAEMRAIGKCNGTPAGVQDDEEDQDMGEDKAALYAAASEHHPELPATRTTIAATIPCEGCAHAPVCRIRPELEQLATVRVEVPKLSDGARLALTGTVECDFFARPKRTVSPSTGEALARKQEAARNANKARWAKRQAAAEGATA